MSLRAMLDGGRPQPTLDVPRLSPRILLMLATATLSLTLLGFLLHVTQGHPVDPALQSLRMELLATSEQLDTALDAEVERARLVLESEPEGFGDVRGRIAAAAQSLRRKESAFNGKLSDKMSAIESAKEAAQKKREFGWLLAFQEKCPDCPRSIPDQPNPPAPDFLFPQSCLGIEVTEYSLGQGKQGSHPRRLESVRRKIVRHTCQ